MGKGRKISNVIGTGESRGYYRKGQNQGTHQHDGGEGKRAGVSEETEKSRIEGQKSPKKTCSPRPNRGRKGGAKLPVFEEASGRLGRGERLWQEGTKSLNL